MRNLRVEDEPQSAVSADYAGLEHKTLTDRVLEQLMQWVVDGTIRMGEKLKTEELSQKLNVSRMPIREAIKELETKGLVESVPYVGARLVTLSKEDIRQIYIMRKALEPIAGYYACLHAAAQDISDVCTIQRDYEQVLCSPSATPQQVYDGNRLFHFSLYRMSNMERICTSIEHLWDNLVFFKLSYGKIYLKDKNARDNAIAEHRAYLSLLQDRNAAGLCEALNANLERLVRDMPELYCSESDANIR
jgi:DNA-binding GntR family transcriptional regulator